MAAVYRPQYIGGEAVYREHYLTAGANDIAVPAGSLTLTGFAPTVQNNASQTIQVPAGSLSLTGFAPTIAFTGNIVVPVPAGGLTLTGYAPDVRNGDEPVRRGGAGPSFHAEIDGKIFRGTRQQIETLLRQLAEQHAEEDEAAIEVDEKPKKRAIRVLGPAQTKVETAQTPSLTVAAPVLKQAGITSTQASDVYERAYAKHMQRKAVEEDDAEVSTLILKHRQAVGAALMKQLEALKGML